jgi:DNA-binding NarL/FixJ family response regulator
MKGGVMTYQLMIVDDHPVVREGLKTFLELQDDLEVIAEAGSLAEAEQQSKGLELDLVLLDLQLSDGVALPLIPFFRSLPKPPKVLILTSYLEESYLREVMRRGASGYLLKHAGPAALLDNVRAALRGEIPLDPSAVDLLTQPAEDPLAELTLREREVLGLIGQGLSNKQIARELGIAEKTVKTHTSNLFAKLRVRDRVQAALLAKEKGL